MSTSILKTLLAVSAPAIALAVSGSGHSTRYWDCCKTSCSWSGKGDFVNQKSVTSCDAKANPITNADAQSGCDGGTAFACASNEPWAIDDSLAYGFAATALNGQTEQSTCCACYKLTFTSGPVVGKTMIVQSTNTGGDLSDNQFDLMIPGGGVGIFTNGCAAQFGKALPGAQYGGVTSRDQCDQMPEQLQAGCQFRFDWFKGADNPNFDFEQVQCPTELTAKSGCTRSDDSSFPAPGGPSGSPSGTSPAPSQPSSSAASAPAPSGTSGAGNAATGGSAATAARFAQCGGSSWTGATACAEGTTCQEQNPYYSQCL